MKNFLKLFNVSEELTAENENPRTGEKGKYVHSRWENLIERAHEIHGAGKAATAWRILWKDQYNDKQWGEILKGTAVAVGNIVTKPIKPIETDLTDSNGNTLFRRKIILAVFDTETPHDALARSTWTEEGRDPIVFLEDAEEAELVNKVVLDEKPEDVGAKVEDEA